MNINPAGDMLGSYLTQSSARLEQLSIAIDVQLIDKYNVVYTIVIRFPS